MGAEDMMAAEGLRTLATHYLAPVRGARVERAARPTQPSAPINVGILDHMKASIAEVVAHAEADARVAAATDPSYQPAPRPIDGPALYAWWRSIPVPGPDRDDARTIVMHRQSLEHAIRSGDTKAVRRERCPNCRCMGLSWRSGEGKAVCLNLRCRDDNGMHRTWTLAELSYHRVVGEKSVHRATS